MEAGLAEEDVSVWSEPDEHLVEQIEDFFLAQVHQQPVREDQVETSTQIRR